MAVRIRLSRTGKKGQVSYRVVITDSRAPRNGRQIEQIGSYNPRANPPAAQIAADRLEYWLKQGAIPSQTVSQILKRQGLLKPGSDPGGAKSAEAGAAPAGQE